MDDYLNAEQRRALWRFAEQHGRRWRSKLRLLWYTGRDEKHPDAAILRQIRNTPNINLNKIKLEHEA